MGLIMERLHPEMTSKSEEDTWLTNTIMMWERPERSGVLDLKEPDLISSLMHRREYSILMKLKTVLLLVSNGLQRKVSFVTKTCEVVDLTFMMSHFMLMPSIEEVVRLSQQLEDVSTLVF